MSSSQQVVPVARGVPSWTSSGTEPASPRLRWSACATRAACSPCRGWRRWPSCGRCHWPKSGSACWTGPSSRPIEGDNPLYLPQAKIYLGGCALGPAIRPAWEITDPYDLGIKLTIWRHGTVAWAGQASTSALRRKFDDLVGYLMRADIHPDGVVLSTGTCLVPPAPFSLADGDIVAVAVTGIGVLTTGVVRGLDRMREAFGQPAPPGDGG